MFRVRAHSNNERGQLDLGEPVREPPETDAERRRATHSDDSSS